MHQHSVFLIAVMMSLASITGNGGWSVQTSINNLVIVGQVK